MEEIRHRAAIAGHITDAISGKGIPEAVVNVIGQNQCTLTVREGFYYFIDLPAGQYGLSSAAPHLGTRYGTASVSDVAVADDTDGRPIFDPKADLPLPPTRLVGQVRRSDNDQAIAQATVQLRGSEAQTVANDLGQYILSGLQQGHPTVQVSAPGFATATQTVTLTTGEATTADFSLTTN